MRMTNGEEGEKSERPNDDDNDREKGKERLRNCKAE